MQQLTIIYTLFINQFSFVNSTQLQTINNIAQHQLSKTTKSFSTDYFSIITATY